jgi:hypothetical protein
MMLFPKIDENCVTGLGNLAREAVTLLQITNRRSNTSVWRHVFPHFDGRGVRKEDSSFWQT